MTNLLRITFITLIMILVSLRRAVRGEEEEGNYVNIQYFLHQNQVRYFFWSLIGRVGGRPSEKNSHTSKNWTTMMILSCPLALGK